MLFIFCIFVFLFVCISYHYYLNVTLFCNKKKSVLDSKTIFLILFPFFGRGCSLCVTLYTTKPCVFNNQDGDFGALAIPRRIQTITLPI